MESWLDKKSSLREESKPGSGGPDQPGAAVTSPVRWGRRRAWILLLVLAALGLLFGLLAAERTAGHPPASVASDRSQDTFERPDQRT